jgi:hypothetical protein
MGQLIDRTECLQSTEASLKKTLNLLKKSQNFDFRNWQIAWKFHGRLQAMHRVSAFAAQIS